MDNPLPKESRLTDKILNHWDTIRGNNLFPKATDLDFDMLEGVLDDCFVVKVVTDPNGEDFQYNYVGENVRHVYGGDLTGIYLSSLDSPELEHIRQMFKQVIATGKPVYDDGEFQNAEHHVVKYRQILVPLGEDRATTILGGMRYKVF